MVKRVVGKVKGNKGKRMVEMTRALNGNSRGKGNVLRSVLAVVTYQC